MGLAKVALNFMVKNGKGELVRSVLCHTRPPKMPVNITGLKYKPVNVTNNKKIPTVLNLKTGKQEQIIIDEIDQIAKDGSHFDISAYNSLGEEIGLVRLKDDPNNQVFRMLGENGKDCLYIDFWATSPKYKGVGTRMLEEIVNISNRSGYGGRVSLQACTGSIPNKFMAVCGYGKAQDISCAIKYHKMGFHSTTPEMESKIQRAILNGDSGLELMKCGLGTGYRDMLNCKMELGTEAINRYLCYNSII